MEKTFEFSKILLGDGDKAWAILARLDRVNDWFPIVTSCRLDTSGPKPRRFCELADGLAIEETITGIDTESRTVHYTVDKGLPVDRYGASFAVRKRPDGRDEVLWRIRVEGEAEVLAQVEAMLGQASEVGLSGLDEAARRTA